MTWFSPLPPRRWPRVRVWILLAAGALALGRLDAPRAGPYPALPRSTAEEATPDSPGPAGPYSPARQRQLHLARLGVDRWHAAGFRGKGIKVAILDSGFRQYRAFLGTALPAHVTARSFRDDGDLEARDSQHGILCGEVIHALAPEAELLFANWEPDRPDRFLDAVRWAKGQGAKVVSCSLIMPSWSDGEGGGAVHEELARLLGSGQSAGDVLCFASAGNTAQRHWHGPFKPGADGWHCWRKKQSANLLTPWGPDRVAVELYGPGAAGYEVEVLDGTTGKEVGRSSAPRNARSRDCCAVVRFVPQSHHRYKVRVRCATPVPGPFHLVVLGGSLNCSTSKGSIPCPADGRYVNAVGAVDGNGRRHYYSSCGPNSPRPKPDFVAEVPFASLWRDRPFAGTSAAAPQAAGLAALWWSRNPTWLGREVAGALRASAVDLGPPGHDCETGYGRLVLP